MMTSVAPFAIFFVGAVFVAMTRGRLSSAITILIPIVGAVNMLGLSSASTGTWNVLDYQLQYLAVDRMSILFGYMFLLAAFIGAIYAWHVTSTIEKVAGTLYAGSALGAVFSGDMITLFIFWEMLAMTSVFLILARRTEASYRAAKRYIVSQISSGVILLAGVLLRYQATGSLAFTHIGLDGTLGADLIFLAFGIKAAFPFLHNWLTDAYPEATPSGTVFLSTFTTKTAIFALAKSFAGTEALVYIGAVMTMFPIFFAVIENDLRRVLSYSLINQLGFMVVGIGLGTQLGINGAISHAFNDVIFKGLLFMSMGAVLYRTGDIRGSKLGGLYKSMPKTTVLCIVGAASISAFPLFSGFVSKSMIMVSALNQGYPWVWLALLFASAGVFHHAGIKIPFFAFFAHDNGVRCKEAPKHMLIAMSIAAAISIFNGVYPWALYSMLPFTVNYDPYAIAHVVTQSQLLFFSALAFVALKLTHAYPPELPSINIDAEWVYRKALPASWRRLIAVLSPIDAALRKAGATLTTGLISRLSRHHGFSGIMARTAGAGSMVLWVIVLLLSYLVLYLFI